jgi:hydroxyquinol 1,2-dioxygenase
MAKGDGVVGGADAPVLRGARASKRSRASDWQGVGQRHGVTPQGITAQALESLGGCRDPRLLEVMSSLIEHLHQFVSEVRLTEDEWQAAIRTLSETGEITDEHRDEFILWSDTLGLSMLVDLLAHPKPAGATEPTVLGPFYLPGAPPREYGTCIFEDPAGTPTWVHGVVTDLNGSPIAQAEIDVWQNGDNGRYAVQDREGPEEHLRGRFRTRHDGSYAFIGVKPTPYPIPDDGPVGHMLKATGRHPWRPAHIHLIVRAAGFETLTTHIFDADSPYLDSDAVFAVKPSLLRQFIPRSADDPDHPRSFTGNWYSVRNDIVLPPAHQRDQLDEQR